METCCLCELSLPSGCTFDAEAYDRPGRYCAYCVSYASFGLHGLLSNAFPQFSAEWLAYRIMLQVLTPDDWFYKVTKTRLAGYIYQ